MEFLVALCELPRSQFNIRTGKYQIDIVISAIKLTEFSRTNLSIISVVKFNEGYCLAGNAVKANLNSALAFNISGESGSAITEICTSYIDSCAVRRISAYLVDYDSVVKAVDYF